MAEQNKGIEAHRRELKIRLLQTFPSSTSKLSRTEVEQINKILDKYDAFKKETPEEPKLPTGRKPARDIPTEKSNEGFILPQNPKEHQLVEEKRRKQKKEIKKIEVADDRRQRSGSDGSGTGSESEEEVKTSKKVKKVVAETPTAPKRTLSDEQRAKLKDIVEGKTTEKPKRVLTDEQKAKMKAGRDAKKAETKKDAPPPDAPETTEKKVRLPVFKIGA